jgi:hypothetical protein
MIFYVNIEELKLIFLGVIRKGKLSSCLSVVGGEHLEVHDKPMCAAWKPQPKYFLDLLPPNTFLPCGVLFPTLDVHH